MFSLSYSSFQAVLHDWYNKDRGVCYPVWGLVHINEPLLKIEMGTHVAAAGFLSRYLSGCLPYVRRYITVNNVLSASLNKTFPSFIH